MCAKLGVKEREGVFEGGRAPAKTMFGRVTVATATLILDASLATCVLGEEWRPQRQVGTESSRNRANYVVVAIVEGPKTIVDGKRISKGRG